MDLVKVEIENLEKISVFNLPFVKKLLNKNFWIAGGFARIFGQLYLENKNDLNNINSTIKSYVLDEYGDIDFFTNNVKNINSVLKNFNASNVIDNYHNNTFRSIFCIEKLVNYNKNNRLIRLQIVDKFIYESIEESFKSFDFFNVMFAIKKVKDKLFLIYSKEGYDLNNKGVLKINNVKSPLLSNRIMKYINFRGFSDVINKEKIKEHLFLILSESWREEYSELLVTNKVFQIQFLHEKKFISSLDLSCFIGFTKRTIPLVVRKKGHPDNDYGESVIQYYEEDWASSLIKQD